MVISKKEIKEYYNNLYFRKKEKAMRSFEDSNFLSYLGSLKKGAKFLDVGCGAGYLLKIAEQENLETYGVDISEEAVKIAQNIAKNSKIEVGQAENLRYSDKFFDYVSCLGSLEHFLNPEKGMAEMVRAAKDNARFLVLVPNDNYLFWKIRKIKKGTTQRQIIEVLKSFEEWSNFFKKFGLKIIRVSQDKYPGQTVRILEYKNPYRILRRIIYKLIWLFMPLKYTYQFIFVLEKV